MKEIYEINTTNVSPDKEFGLVEQWEHVKHSFYNI